MRDNEKSGEAGEDVCDLCGQPLTGEEVRFAFVPDSSAVHEDSDWLDGQRLVLACSDEHLVRLRESYARRRFVEPELWAGKIERALRQHRCWLSGRRLRRATGLAAWEIRQALQWRAASRSAGPPHRYGGTTDGCGGGAWPSVTSAGNRGRFPSRTGQAARHQDPDPWLD